MSNSENPLAPRGKAIEDKWARDRDKELIEAMRKKDKSGTGAADKTAPNEDSKGGSAKPGEAKSGLVEDKTAAVDAEATK